VSWQRCREDGGIGVGAADLDDDISSRAVFARLWVLGAGHGDVGRSRIRHPIRFLSYATPGVASESTSGTVGDEMIQGDRVAGRLDSRAREEDGLEDVLEDRHRTKKERGSARMQYD
jgi:hypothetical protein